MAYGAKTVPATANGIQVVDKCLSRISLWLYNNSAVTIWLGEDDSVTTANGWPLLAGEKEKITHEGNADSLPLFYRDAVYAIVASGTADLRYWEMLPALEFD